jgi:hypothetical protein
MWEGMCLRLKCSENVKGYKSTLTTAYISSPIDNNGRIGWDGDDWPDGD